MKAGYTHDKVSREFKESDCYVMLGIVIYTGIFTLIFTIL